MTVALIVHSLGTISLRIVRMVEPYWFLIALAVVARTVAIEEYIRARRQEAARAARTVTQLRAGAQPAAASVNVAT